MTRRGVGFATHAHVPPTLPNPLLIGHVIHSSKVPRKQPKHNAHVIMGEHSTHGGTTSSAMLSTGGGGLRDSIPALGGGEALLAASVLSWQEHTHTHTRTVSARLHRVHCERREAGSNHPYHSGCCQGSRRRTPRGWTLRASTCSIHDHTSRVSVNMCMSTVVVRTGGG